MQLGLEIDDFGILRCHGHYLHSKLSEMKYPKLLPRREHFTQLVIREVHRRLIHAGVSHTLSQVRQEYWVVQGRAEVRQVIGRCLICMHHSKPTCPWPNSRSTPFRYIGLDYLGPIRVKEGDGLEKVCLHV